MTPINPYEPPQCEKEPEPGHPAERRPGGADVLIVWTCLGAAMGTVLLKPLALGVLDGSGWLSGTLLGGAAGLAAGLAIVKITKPA
jgi:hypothetical protein